MRSVQYPHVRWTGVCADGSTASGRSRNPAVGRHRPAGLTRSIAVTVRVGINGFGRIGRNFFRAALAHGRRHRGRRASTTSTDNKTLAHLLKYDSILGRLAGTCHVDRRRHHRRRPQDPALEERDPANLPWKDLGVDVVARVHRLLHRRHQGQGPPRRRRQEGHHLRAGQERGRHDRAWASTTATTTRPSTTSSPTPPAPRTASPRWPRC